MLTAMELSVPGLCRICGELDKIVCFKLQSFEFNFVGICATPDCGEVEQKFTGGGTIK
jgi:hypothetical protein